MTRGLHSFLESSPDKDTARGWVVLFCSLAAALPFLLTKFAPIADLPQQVAQIRLFLEALSGQSSYTVDWLAPNRLSYGVLGLVWSVVPPVHVGRIAMLLLCIAWIVSIHMLAAHRGRSAAAAALVGALFFNRSLYWGFYGFILGMPLFLLWIARFQAGDGQMQRSGTGWKLAAGSFILLMLLYFAHALWFAAALVWLAIRSILIHKDMKALLWRALGALPLIIMALIWYPRMKGLGFTSATYWGMMPWERISSNWVVDASLGGLVGRIEPLYLVILILWMLVGMAQHRERLREKTDGELLICAGIFIAAAVLLPYKHTNTIEFAERWLPVGIALLALALPAPSWKRGMEKVLAVAVMVGFCIFTATQWTLIDRNEFSGLTAALDALPEGASVIGVDLQKTSKITKLRQPFLQTFAYAQVVRGGTLNFSFADHPNSLVRYTSARTVRWTPKLEWWGERVTERDLKQFDYAIVGGHAILVHNHPFILKNLTPVSTTGVWRLYKPKR
jgi:hypothetical protein